MAVYQEKDKTKWTKDGRKWYFITYKNKKKYKSKKFLTKKEAQDEEAIFKLKRDVPYSKPFFLIAHDYFDEMYKKRKESTIYCYENIFKKNILPYFKTIDINKINMKNISEWHNALDNTKLSVSYKNKLNTILKSILSFAQKNYGLDKNYAEIFGGFEKPNDEIVDDKNKIRYITLEEYNRFISAIDNELWKTFFSFLYYTGMRKGEVQALKWNDIDLDNSQVIVNKTISTKTKHIEFFEEKQSKFKITNTKNCKNRIVKINSSLKNTLLVYKNSMKKYKDFSENWYVFGNTRFLPETSINRYKHRYFMLSNVNEITIHEFRHSHVSLLINEYVKSNQTDTAKFFLMMSNRMGHTVKVMQDTYMHLFPTIQNEIVDLLEKI